MGLSARKEKILQAVVDSYVNSCVPVSSAEIKEKLLPALSTATIRNELSDLERQGYLAQPHTSSGRVPTAEAYRLYVEKLMPRRKLTRSELKIVKRYFNRTITELDDMLKSTAKVISEITNLTSVAYVHNVKDARIERIKIIGVSATTALVVIVTDRGVLKDAMMRVAGCLTDEFCENAGRFVTSAFGGHLVSEIVKPKALIKQVRKEYENVFKTVFKILKTYAHEEMVSDIVLEGSAKILEQPEYENLAKAKAMLELLDAKEDLLPVLANNDDMNLSIKIAKDNELKDGAPECAIITANYAVNGVQRGNAGVIGPIRMDYAKVVSVLDYIGKTMNFLPLPAADDSGAESDETDSDEPVSGENLLSKWSDDGSNS